VSTEQATLVEDEPEEMDIPTALRAVLAADPLVLLDALIAVFRFAREAAHRPKGKYHTVVIPDLGEEGTVTTVDSFDEFLALWCRIWQHQRSGQLLGFTPNGERILPSQDGYMVTPWGRFPLFVEGDAAGVDPLGRLGPIPPVSKAVPVPADTAPINENDEEGLDQEEEEDVDEDVDEDELEDDD
jgi:hypothetical protein